MPELIEMVKLPDPNYVYCGKIHEAFSIDVPVHKIICVSLIQSVPASHHSGDTGRYEVGISIHIGMSYNSVEIKTVVCESQAYAFELFNHVVCHLKGGRP